MATCGRPSARRATSATHFTNRCAKSRPAIFSFCDSRVAALGIARSYCYESPKPAEFGKIGGNWGPIGWKVEVAFRELVNRVRPKDHIAELRALLPAKYSPLRIRSPTSVVPLSNETLST